MFALPMLRKSRIDGFLQGFFHDRKAVDSDIDAAGSQSAWADSYSPRQRAIAEWWRNLASKSKTVRKRDNPPRFWAIFNQPGQNSGCGVIVYTIP